MRVTISMPCYLRPERTKRAIESVMAQNTNGWELLIGGDGCPNISNLMETSYFDELSEVCNARGNSLVVYNLEEKQGGWGYAVTNTNIKIATGKYFTFLDNDDVIKPNHIESYLSEVEAYPEVDICLFKTYIEPFMGEKDSMILMGSVGHSQIIIKTEFARTIPPHDSSYNHDWNFLQSAIKMNARIKHSNNPSTYIVKSVPNKPENGIN